MDEIGHCLENAVWRLLGRSKRQATGSNYPCSKLPALSKRHQIDYNNNPHSETLQMLLELSKPKHDSSQWLTMLASQKRSQG